MKSSLLHHSSRLCLLFVAALTAQAQPIYPTPYFFTTLAGVSSIGSQDGTGAAARFFSPRSVATDSAGNAYVVDAGNHTIRKVTPAGEVTTYAGAPGLAGTADGTGATARFDSPQGIAADFADNLYVTDTGNHTIRKITPAGLVTTFAGSAGIAGNVDGVGAAARFNRPRGIATDGTGQLFVTEAGNSDVRKISPFGTVSTFVTHTSFPEEFSSAFGAVAVDRAGNVFLCEFSFLDTRFDSTGQIVSQRPVGFVVRIIPSGTRELLFESNRTSALVIDTAGQLIVKYGSGVSTVSLSDNSSPVFKDLSGSRGIGASDGDAVTASFGEPFSLTYSRDGTLFVADTGNNNVRKVAADGTVTTIAGLALEKASDNTDGTGPAARFQQPSAAAVDANGNVYVTDPISHCVRKISPAGEVSTLAGSPGTAGTADGTGTAARFNAPTGIAVARDGTVYVADTLNHTIRLVRPSGETQTFAGKVGESGALDGQGAAARFERPSDIAIEADDTLYVVDAGNKTVRKISPDGTTTTLADNGSGWFSRTEGSPDNSKKFNQPSGIAIDGSGTLYLTDIFTGGASIHKITAAGAVTTLISQSNQLPNPSGIAADTAGNLFVTDSFTQALSKITPNNISTIAGLSRAPGSTDGVGSAARFYYPQGIAVDRSGFLYVTSGTTVRKGQLAGPPVISSQPQSQAARPGDGVALTVTAGGVPAPTYQWYFNGSPFSGATGSTLTFTNARASDAGDYTVVVTNALGSVTSNKATLTVTSAPTPAPPPAPASGGGGGGAISWWALAALLVTSVVRSLTTRRQAIARS